VFLKGATFDPAQGLITPINKKSSLINSKDSYARDELLENSDQPSFTKKLSSNYGRYL